MWCLWVAMNHDSDGSFIPAGPWPIPEVQGGFVAMDVTQRVIAYAGRLFLSGIVFNRRHAGQSGQPGQSFKPFVYAACGFDRDIPRPSFVDAPIESIHLKGCGGRRNSSNKFLTAHALRQVIEQSRTCDIPACNKRSV